MRIPILTQYLESRAQKKKAEEETQYNGAVRLADVLLRPDDARIRSRQVLNWSDKVAEGAFSGSLGEYLAIQQKR